jgi:hypothetical protein
VNKDVLRSVRRLDKAVPAHVIKAENYAVCHLYLPCNKLGTGAGRSGDETFGGIRKDLPVKVPH